METKRTKNIRNKIHNPEDTKGYSSERETKPPRNRISNRNQNYSSGEETSRNRRPRSRRNDLEETDEQNSSTVLTFVGFGILLFGIFIYYMYLKTEEEKQEIHTRYSWTIITIIVVGVLALYYIFSGIKVGEAEAERMRQEEQQRIQEREQQREQQQQEQAQTLNNLSYALRFATFFTPPPITAAINVIRGSMRS